MRLLTSHAAATDSTSLFLPRPVLVLAIMLSKVLVANAWMIRRAPLLSTHLMQLSSTNDEKVNDGEILDVSDLGLTMEDLEQPLPPNAIQAETSGYESTSRIPDVDDQGCEWTESSADDGSGNDTLNVVLKIPGLRGQPSAAMAVITATTTISVSVFGRIIWSAILRGSVLPETATYQCQDGNDGIPIIDYQVQKDGNADINQNRRWDGFILQIGEDSLI